MAARKQSNIDLTNIVSGPRTKKGRVSYVEDDQDVEMADAEEPVNPVSSKVLEQGMRLWNAVKNYKDPSTGRELSYDFMKLVPRKQYPDYYKVITRPMALDMVKSRLELNGYPSVESVMADLELIFENAKTYNVEGSGIYSDAADLHNVLLREYRTLMGTTEEQNENQAVLEKLLADTTREMVEATDENGTNLAFYFMDLPDGNLYPQYYHVIQKPMCFNHILRKIPRHEYTTATGWGQDVELIFQNAATFNEDDSPIVVQAKALQLLYNALIDRFPPEFTVEKSAPRNPVIKLKVGRPRKSEVAAVGVSTPVKGRQGSASSSVRPNISATPEATVKSEEVAKIETPPPPPVSARPQTPAQAINVKQQPAQTPAVSTPQLPQQTPMRPPIPATPVSTVRPSPFPTQTRPYGYPANLAQPQVISGPPFQSSFVLGPPTPLPEGMMKNPIILVALKTQPLGRTIYLDAREGVSSWSVRLSGGKRETSLTIDSVEIEDEDEPVDEEMKEEPEEPKPKRRGRPPTRSLAAQQAMMNGNGHVKKVAAIEYLRGLAVKLNGKTLSPNEPIPQDPTLRQWNVELAAGASVLDIGAWRVYVERD